MAEWQYRRYVDTPRRGERALVAEGGSATVQVDADGLYWYVRMTAPEGHVLGDMIRGPYQSARAAIAGGEAPWAQELPL